MDKTIILYLIGKPGVGKYTIAKEIKDKYGFIVCDNHLINNPIFSLLHGPSLNVPDLAWSCIARIRDVILRFLSRTQENSYVFTNCLDNTDDDRIVYEKVKAMAEARGSIFVPVQFLINKEEHLKRIVSHERQSLLKVTDPRKVEDTSQLLIITHPNLLILEVSYMSPGEVAQAIMEHIRTCSN